MSLREEFKYDVRRVGVPMLRYGGLALGAVMFGLVAVVVVVAVAAGQLRLSPQELTDIEAGDFAVAEVQSLDCIRVGEAECPQYDRALETMRRSLHDGVAYQPIRNNVPQAETTFAPDPDTPDSVFVEYADAVTFEGAASPDTVRSEVTRQAGESAAEFDLQVGGSTWTGTMTFDIEQQGVSLVSVKYVRARS